MIVEGCDGRVSRLEEIEAALTPVLAGCPSVMAAWLFGSVATGDDGPLSDVDIAVLGGVAWSFDERAKLVADLGGAIGRSCDVVVVEHASPVLAMAIVDTGRRFVCRDADAADAWEDGALRRYLDTANLRRIVYQYVHEDLRAPQ